MAQATAFTSARSKAIEDKAVTSGSVDAAGNLTLTTKDGTAIAAGNVKGPKGDPGDNVDAKAYSDAGDATTLASAKSYTDSAKSTIDSRWNNNAMVTPVSLDGTTDLNNVTANGVYFQSANARAASAPNYPIAYAGVLEVQNSYFTGDGSNQIYQRYTHYSQMGHRTFVRGYYTTTGWSAWQEQGPMGTLVRVGRNTRTSNTANSTTEYNICTVTLSNPVNGDVYAVKGGANISPDTAGMYTGLRLKHATGANVGGTQIAQIYLDHRIAGRVVGGEVSAEFTYTGTTGATGYNVVLVGGPAGGGSLVQASATQPAYLYVDKVL